MLYHLTGGALIALAFVAVTTLSNPILPAVAAVAAGFAVIAWGQHRRERGHGHRFRR